MSAKILDGKKIADEIMTEIATKRATYGLDVSLAIVSVGDDPASDVYIKNKLSACKKCGFTCSILATPHLNYQSMNNIEDLSRREDVHGLIVQLPVPKAEAHLISALEIPSDTDVDGFLSADSDFDPCTPKGIMRLLEEAYPPRDSLDELSGLNAVVVGRSKIVGKPIAEMLLKADCTVTVCHSHTQNLAMHTKNADILIVAAGKPGLITADMVKPGAVVIDVGINRVNGKLVGDVDFEGVKEVAGWITPVPGGVGPMTVAMLMQNTFDAALMQTEELEEAE